MIIILNNILYALITLVIAKMVVMANFIKMVEKDSFIIDEEIIIIGHQSQAIKITIIL